MEFVQLKLTIDVELGTMTKEQYKEFAHFFKHHFLNSKQLDNSYIIDKLDLDKRPFFVTEFKEPKSNDKLINLAEIKIIC